MRDNNRLNTVRTDRLMTPMETEIAARNLMDVENAIKVKRETPVSILDYIVTFGMVAILLITVIVSMLGVV